MSMKTSKAEELAYYRGTVVIMKPIDRLLSKITPEIKLGFNEVSVANSCTVYDEAIGIIIGPNYFPFF